MVLLAYLPEIATFLLLIMMGTQLPQIGPILILCEFALVGLLFVFRTTTFIDALTRWWWLLLLPIIATLTALWSDLPMVSVRYGAQFLFTAFVGVLLARLLPPKRYVLTLHVALFVFCILCILNGRQGTTFDGMVLIGLTGSKNQMGLASQLLMLTAVTVLLMQGVPRLVRWIALASLPLSAYLVLGADSATALLMSAGGVVAICGLWFAQRLPPGGRLGALIAAAIVIVPLTALLPEATAFVNHFVFDTLNKDPTLTGRTFLWQSADVLIQRRPLFGYGYQAFWMGNSVDAIAIREVMGITDGRQFHFHHQFRQVLVDTGLLGLIPFVGMLLTIAYGHIRQVLLRPTLETSFFFILFALMVSRAFTDLIINPFNMHTLLFFASGVYAFAKPEPVPAPARQTVFGRPLGLQRPAVQR